MSDDDPYWEAPCKDCASEDRHITNLECATELSVMHNMPIEMFRPKVYSKESTTWSQGEYK